MGWVELRTVGAAVVVFIIFMAHVYAEDAGNERRSRDGQSGVHVDASFEAGELIERLEKLTGDGAWFEASRVADVLVSEHGRRLLRREKGRFVSVVVAVHRIQRSWPAAGLAVYRDLYDERAESALTDAVARRDVDAVVAVLHRYLWSTHGPRMGRAAFDLALEAGHFVTAGRVCAQVLNAQPGERVAREFRARLLVADAMRAALHGDDLAPERIAEETDPGLRLLWHGERRSLREILSLIERDGTAGVALDRLREWPVFGGRTDRQARRDLAFDDLATVWRFDEGFRAIPSDGERGGDSSAIRQAVDSGKLLNLMPIVADGAVYLHDARHVWAIHARSGTLAWRYDVARKGGDGSGSGEGYTTGWHSPAYGDGKVFACLGNEVVSYYGYETTAGTSSVLALDASTGTPVWQVTPRQLGDDFDKCTFASAPLYSEGSLFVIARRQRTFGFEDCYLMRLDARSGSLRWSTHLGSASVGGFGYRRSTFAIPALVDGTVYVATQLGTLAAVSARTGLVDWLSAYERAGSPERSGFMQSSGGEVLPWQHSPVLVDGAYLVCKPLDAADVLVFDRVTGSLVRSIDIAETETTPALYALRDGRLYGVGNGVFAVDVVTGARVWSAPLPDDDAPMGRGVATGSDLLVPSRTALLAYDLSTGARRVHGWEVADGFGNIVPAGEQIVVAGLGHVSAMGRRSHVWARLHAEMAAREWDPSPALDLAEIAYRGGKHGDCMTILEMAIVRLQGHASAVDAGVRRRAFDNCLRFARDWPGGTELGRKQIVQLFGWAGVCADDVETNVAYRLTFAAYLSESGDHGQAVGVYQQILDRRELRRSFVGRDGAQQFAGTIARRAIEKLMARHGRGIYRAWDEEAAQWLQGADDGGDVHFLDRIIDSRPNAKVFADALMARGRRLLQDGQAVAAAGSFTRALAERDGAAGGADATSWIVRSFRQAGWPNVADAWLGIATRRHPNARVKGVDGKRVSLTELAQGAAVSPRLFAPKSVGDDLVARHNLLFPDDIELLEPRWTVRDDVDWDVIHVAGGGVLQVYSAITGDLLWQVPLDDLGQSARLLVATDDVHVLAGRHRVRGYDAHSGRTLWSVGRRPEQLDDPHSDPEWFSSFFAHALEGDVLISVMDDGGASAVQIKTGERFWSKSLAHRPTSPISSNGNLFAYATNDTGRPACVLVDVRTGREQKVIPMLQSVHPARLHLTAEHRLIVVTTQAVMAYDARLGELSWITMLDGLSAPSTATFDVEGVYLGDDGNRFQKINLATGDVVWTSEPLVDHGVHGGTLHLQDGQLLLMSERGVIGLNADDGRTQWTHVLPPGSVYVFHAMTRRDVLAVETMLHEEATEYVLRRLNHQSVDGVVDVGSMLLGEQDGVRGFAVRNGSLFLVRDKMISGFASPQRAVKP